MSRITLSTKDLFERLGPTPRSRSARADRLFRRLRNGGAAEARCEETQAISAMLKSDPAGANEDAETD